MKILQICNKAPFPANDGSSIAMANMALGLNSLGVEIKILSLNTKKHFKKPNNLPSQFKLNKNYFVFNCNTNPTVIGALSNLFSSKSYFVSRFYIHLFEKKIIEIINDFNPDIVQFEGLSMCVYLNKIKNITKAKIVLRAHNVEYRIWDRHRMNISNFFNKWYFKKQIERLKRFEIEVFNNSNAIVSITNEDKIEIEKYCKTSIFVSMTGIETKKYKLSTNQTVDKNSIFHFGSMDWIPNQEGVDWFLHNCWDKILQKKPDCHFILAGRNIPSRYHQLNKKNVIIIENVPNADEIYNKYNVMIVPLLSGSGLRIKLIEGMTYGKPIVSTTIGAEGIPYTKNKELIISDNAEDFCQSIIKILSIDNLNFELSTNARKFALEFFDLKKSSSDLVNFYQKLIK